MKWILYVRYVNIEINIYFFFNFFFLKIIIRHICICTNLQQYHTLDKHLKNKNVESNYYAEDVIRLQTENKSLAEEIVSN